MAAECVTQELRAGQHANQESTVPRVHADSADCVVQEKRAANTESTVPRVNADSADSEASTGTDFDPSESRLRGVTQPTVAGMPVSSQLRK